MFGLDGNISNSFVLSFLYLAGICSTTLLTPLVIRLARKVGAIDFKESGQNIVPTLGGLSVALPILLFSGLASGLILFRQTPPRLALEIWSHFSRFLPKEFALLGRSVLVLSIGGLAVVILGVIDDLLGLQARGKLLGQFIIAVFICAGGIMLRHASIPLIGSVSLNPVIGIPITILWIIGMINAFNLIDGLDGLAAGVGLIACVALIVMGTITGDAISIFICTILAGSLTGFLFFNFPPARIFLGDTGSMFIGYILATVTLMKFSSHKSETAVILLAPVLALSIPIFETIISVIRRFIRGVPILSGDRSHTHHRLLKKGLTPRQAVLFLYLVTLCSAAAAIISQVIPQGGFREWIPAAIVIIAMIVTARWAGYLRRVSFRMIPHRRRRNVVFRSFSKYAVQALTSVSPAISYDEILSLCRRELELNYLEAWFEEGRVLIGLSGEPVSNEANRINFDTIKRLRVKTVAGLIVIIRYQFRRQPDRSEFEDVTDCLAGIFKQAGINLLLKKTISLQGEMKDRKILEGIERELSL